MTIHKIFRDGEIVEVEGEVHEIFNIPPVLRRMSEYSIAEQLNLLVDDIQAGHFGEAAKTGQFMNYVRSIKERHPKQP
jgi:hypothetical protein